MKNIIKNEKNLFLSKTLRGTRINVWDKFSKLCVKDIEHRAQGARSTYFGARSAMRETSRSGRAQSSTVDANVALMDIK